MFAIFSTNSSLIALANFDLLQDPNKCVGRIFHGDDVHVRVHLHVLRHVRDLLRAHAHVLRLLINPYFYLKLILVIMSYLYHL